LDFTVAGSVSWRATSLSVFFSPDPPIMISGCGRDTTQRLWRVDGLGELVVLALKRAHGCRSTSGERSVRSLLQPLEPLSKGWERNPEGVVFAFEPRRADAEHRPSAGENI
jgi:hypothetical protein